MERSPEEAWPHFRGWRVNYDPIAVEIADLIDAAPAPWSGRRTHFPEPIAPRRPVDRRPDDPQGTRTGGTWTTSYQRASEDHERAEAERNGQRTRGSGRGSDRAQRSPPGSGAGLPASRASQQAREAHERAEAERVIGQGAATPDARATPNDPP